ncbi:hypothetical protein ACTXT7_015139 [Hymenolepis weldensis]
MKSAWTLTNDFRKYLMNIHISFSFSHQCKALAENRWPMKVDNSTISFNHLSSLANYRVHKTHDVDQMTLENLCLNLLPEKSVFPVKEEEEEMVMKALKPLTEAGFLKLLSPDDFSPTDKLRNTSTLPINPAHTVPRTNVKFIYDPALHNSSQAYLETREINDSCGTVESAKEEAKERSPNDFDQYSYLA